MNFFARALLTTLTKHLLPVVCTIYMPDIELYFNYMILAENIQPTSDSIINEQNTPCTSENNIVSTHKQKKDNDKIRNSSCIG